MSNDNTRTVMPTPFDDDLIEVRPGVTRAIKRTSHTGNTTPEWVTEYNKKYNSKGTSMQDMLDAKLEPTRRSALHPESNDEGVTSRPLFPAEGPQACDRCGQKGASPFADGSHYHMSCYLEKKRAAGVVDKPSRKGKNRS